MHHEPKSLREIVGQPAVRHLQSYAACCRTTPASRCWLLEGPPGTGKSASAAALANELGCFELDDDKNFTGLFREACSELTVDRARELFRGSFRFRYGSATGMTMLILEELEWISPQCQRFLKTALDPVCGMSKTLCVVATSNDASGLDKALLNRFKIMPFSNGKFFQEACRERLAKLWDEECGARQFWADMPCGWSIWGVDEDGSFSMRSALASLYDALNERVLLEAA